jgi:hypothetical protein
MSESNQMDLITGPYLINRVVSFQIKYPVDCSDYDAEDMKATTEYAHNEL